MDLFSIYIYTLQLFLIFFFNVIDKYINEITYKLNVQFSDVHIFSVN